MPVDREKNFMNNFVRLQKGNWLNMMKKQKLNVELLVGSFCKLFFCFFEISTGTTHLFLLGNRQALKLTTAGPNSHVFEF
jgi:hypothetical protein